MHDPALDPLVARAREVATKAYAPASKFRVGAVLVADDGRVFAGCNVENASYGLTICAERAAVFHAVAEGAKRFVRCVIFTDTSAPTYPCGACRQVLAEFGPDMEIVMADASGAARRTPLSELLPEPFRF
jgi:cytidine deaminase